jgi:type IV pilus assembly protein PilE
MNTLKVKQKGFSLIEVMVVVAIIGILAAIVVPSYKDYIQRARATEATSVLADMRIKMEQCFQDNRSYAPCAAICIAPVGTNTTNFAFSCVAAPTATAYTLQAVGQAAGDMTAFSYTVDQTNAKTSTTAEGGGGNCWVTKVGAAC